MNVLKTPWKKDLLELVNQSKKSVKITSPFITRDVCADVLEIKKPTTTFELITSFKLKSIYSGFLDLRALEDILVKKGIIKNHSKLHAKVYLFDEEIAIVTSANLTYGGIIKNYEYGVLIDERSLVSTIANDFRILSNDENTGIIKKSDIETVKTILHGIAKSHDVKLPTYNIKTTEETDDIIETNIEPIKESLTGWRLDVFNCINEISEQIFLLTDVYKYEPFLKKKYATNRHIKDKLRQQLQILRDIGLIEFLGSGKYKKLWKQKDS